MRDVRPIPDGILERSRSTRKLDSVEFFLLMILRTILDVFSRKGNLHRQRGGAEAVRRHGESESVVIFSGSGSPFQRLPAPPRTGDEFRREPID